MKNRERIRLIFKKIRFLHYQSLGIDRMYHELLSEQHTPEHVKKITGISMLTDWTETLNKMDASINNLRPLVKSDGEATSFLNDMGMIVKGNRDFIEKHLPASHFVAQRL